MKDGLLLLVVVGFGGLVIYFLTRPPAPAPLPPVTSMPPQMCGASYAGVGASVPCNLIGKGVKELYEQAAGVVASSGLGGEASKATSGFGLAEVALAPVAATHFAYNEIKRLKFW